MLARKLLLLGLCLFFQTPSNLVFARDNLIIQTIAGGGFGDGGLAISAQLYADASINTDTHGNVYFSDGNCSCIRKIGLDGLIGRVAGDGSFGYAGDDGLATQARLDKPSDVIADAAGNLFIADSMNHVIRKIDDNGLIHTIAGSGEGHGGFSGSFYGDGGPAEAAGLSLPHHLAFDSAGNLYVADNGNHRIRRIDGHGIITTIAGNGSSDSSGDGALATQAGLSNLGGMIFDKNDNLYFIDGNLLRVIDTAGIIDTVAGNGSTSADGGPALQASLNNPQDVALDSYGNVYVSEYARIRKIDAAGMITTVAGSGSSGDYWDGDGGPALAASLMANGIAMDKSGHLYIAANEVIRMIDAGGIIHTIAGGGVGDGGIASSAALYPERLAFDNDGNLYIADTGHDRIRKIDRYGVISTIAGNGKRSFSGDGAPALDASLNQPYGVAVDQQGNVFIADSANYRIRKINSLGTISTVAGNGRSEFSGDAGPAVEAGLLFPVGLAIDPAGEVLIADSERVRKIDAQGTISTIAGGGDSWSDNQPATALDFLAVRDVLSDKQGNVYIADSGNCRIWKVNPLGSAFRIAGRGDRVACEFSGDGGDARSAALRYPYGMALDGSDNLYIADSGNERVRKITPGGSIATIAGTGQKGFSGDDAEADLATLNSPHGLALDSQGSLYISDTGNYRIRKLATSLIATEFAMNVRVSGKGKVTSLPKGINCGIKCSKIFGKDTFVTLKAKAAKGYRFTGWGGACSSANLCELPITATTDVSASFMPIYKLQIKKQGKGLVESDIGGIHCGKRCSGKIVKNSYITLLATPAAGYDFIGWVGACSESTTNICELPITASTKIKALFDKIR